MTQPKTIRTSSGGARLSAGGTSTSSTVTGARPADSVNRDADRGEASPSATKVQSPSSTARDSKSRLPLSGDDDNVRASSSGVKMSGKSSRTGPRTVRLNVASVDPWSVMKLSFLMSVAIGIATVVAFFVIWLVLQTTGVMNSMETTLAELAGSESAERVIGIFSLGRILSVSIVLSVVNIILITALSTLIAFLYNIGSKIVGGFHLTLTDD